MTSLHRTSRLICLLLAFAALAAHAQQRPRPAAGKAAPPAGQRAAAPANAAPRKAIPPRYSRDTALAQIVALARPYPDSVRIRFAPGHPSLLYAVRQAGVGFRLTRYPVAGGVPGLRPDFVRYVKPWTLEEMKARLGRADTLGGACAQLLYGKKAGRLAPEKTTFSGLLRQQNESAFELMFSLLLADENYAHARALGLAYTDKEVRAGQSYLYVVSAVAPPLQPDSARITAGPGKTPPVPGILPLGAATGERRISLTWPHVATLSPFTAYEVERSADGGKTFRRLHRGPYVPNQQDNRLEAVFTDTAITANYVRYTYRVRGITSFGERSAYASLTAYAVDRTPPTPPVDFKVVHQGGAKVDLSWKMAATPDLAGFAVAKAASADGPFTPLTQKLLPATTTAFTDPLAVPEDPAYYKVVAVDTAGNQSQTLPLYCYFKDEAAPAKPTGLQGYIDSTGRVKLIWDTNKDKDLLGYYVLMANKPTHVFVNQTMDPLAIPVFNDTTTLNTLTKHLYYRVCAVDTRYKVSVQSDILTLRRPDTVAPGPPIVNDYRLTDSAVSVQYAVGFADDVREVELQRRGSAVDTAFRTVARHTGGQEPVFADRTAQPSAFYEYRLFAIDSAGNRSRPSPVLGIRTMAREPAPVRGFKAAAAEGGKAVSLSWPHGNDASEYILFRRDPGQDFKPLRRVSRTGTYLDDKVRTGQTYAYRVRRVEAATGKTSVFSPIVEVRL